MPMSDLMNDSIDLLKENGTKIEGLKASVQKSNIFMEAKGILVEPGDLIVRKMSNGGEETYRVIDPGFCEPFHGIKAHYQMDVQRLGLPEAKRAVHNIVYNISGNNARINQNSIDNSTNVVQINKQVIKYIEELRKEIQMAEISDLEKREAMEIVDEVESAFNSQLPKKSVITALLKALPHVANITSIASAIVGLSNVS